MAPCLLSLNFECLTINEKIIEEMCITEPVALPVHHIPLLKLCRLSSGYVPICCSALFVKVFIWSVQLLFGSFGLCTARGCFFRRAHDSVKATCLTVHDMYFACTVRVREWLTSCFRLMAAKCVMLRGTAPRPAYSV